MGTEKYEDDKQGVIAPRVVELMVGEWEFGNETQLYDNLCQLAKSHEILREQVKTLAGEMLDIGHEWCKHDVDWKDVDAGHRQWCTACHNWIRERKNPAEKALDRIYGDCADRRIHAEEKT